MHCICVDPAHVDKIWPMVSDLIRGATKKGGGADFDSLQQSVLAGEKLLWIAVDETAIWAAVITGLHIQGTDRMCIVWAAAGKNREKWFDLMKSAVEAFAKAEGCNSVRISGRRGWAREFPDYKLICVVLEKAI